MGSHDYTLFKHEVKPKYGRTIKATALRISLKEGEMGGYMFAYQVFNDFYSNQQYLHGDNCSLIFSIN